jgi:hypothetical protein
MPLNQIGPDALGLVLRTRLPNPLLISSEVARATRDLDLDVPIYDLRSMEWYVDYQAADWRFPTLLSNAFAGLCYSPASAYTV